jgi:hypothetical protein
MTRSIPLAVLMRELATARDIGAISEDIYDQVTSLACAAKEAQRIADSLGDPNDNTFKDLAEVRAALLKDRTNTPFTEVISPEETAVAPSQPETEREPNAHHLQARAPRRDAR